MHRLTDISGTAKCGSKVCIFADDNELIGECRAGADGQWKIQAQLAVGNHDLRASVRDSSGVEIESAETTHTVDDEPESELSAEDQAELDMLRAEQAADRAALLQRAEDEYFNLVQASADGCEIDTDVAEAVLHVLGRTVDQFSADASELRAIAAEQYLRDVLFHEKCEALKNQV